MAAVSLKRIGQFRFTFVRGSFGIQVSPVGSYAESRRPTWASWKDSMRPIHVGSFRQQKTEEIDVEKLVNADQTARLLLTEKTVNKSHPSRFGFMFDIDGVLVRGRRAIPRATVAMKKVLQLGIPTIFLTNGGCETEEHKAKVLSTQLHHKVTAINVAFLPSSTQNNLPHYSYFAIFHPSYFTIPAFSALHYAIFD